MFQSEFQRSEFEPQLAEFGYTPDRGYLIRGAFDLEELPFAPRSHQAGDVFVVGRMARPDLDKWSRESQKGRKRGVAKGDILLLLLFWPASRSKRGFKTERCSRFSLPVSISKRGENKGN